jgi:hypothetical protein
VAAPLPSSPSTSAAARLTSCRSSADIRPPSSTPTGTLPIGNSSKSGAKTVHRSPFNDSLIASASDDGKVRPRLQFARHTLTWPGLRLEGTRGLLHTHGRGRTRRRRALGETERAHEVRPSTRCSDLALTRPGKSDTCSSTRPPRTS